MKKLILVILLSVIYSLGLAASLLPTDDQVKNA